MKVRNIPVGTRVRLGRTRRRPDRREEMDMVWVKCSEDNRFLSVTAICLPYDGPSFSRKGIRNKHGVNCFPMTDMYQYLNATQENWFAPQDEFDELHWRYKPETYFLKSFLPFELDALKPHTIRCKVPSGMIRQYGKYINAECLVSLPSVSELDVHGNDDFHDEGTAFAPSWADGLPDRFSARNMATRTPNTGIGFRLQDDTDSSSYLPENDTFVYPEIMLQEDCNLKLFADDNGIEVYCVVDENGQSWDVGEDELVTILGLN